MTLTDLDISMCRSKLMSDGISDPTNEQIAMHFIRDRRNGLLLNCDWMACSDVSMPDAWKKYRKDLRDLPSIAKPKLDENGHLTGVTWPTKPE